MLVCVDIDDCKITGAYSSIHWQLQDDVHYVLLKMLCRNPPRAGIEKEHKKRTGRK